METLYRTALVPDAADCDLARSVYCILGLPIDAVDMPTVLRQIDSAAVKRIRFLISTPNLNFLVNSQRDPEFRESILSSDLCPADGMPIVWIARLISAPIRQRVSGADIFEALKVREYGAHPLKIFLFGGAEGAAAAAARALNVSSSGLRCVGAFNPGFGTVEELSHDHMLDLVNASKADFLAASLGAKKGQLWLHRNHRRLDVPVRAHLGAAINFQAGTVKRAPLKFQAWGIEWVWRIKEEPQLWRRYASDGLLFLGLIFAHVLPLAIDNRWHRFKSRRWPRDLLVNAIRDHDSVTITLCGDATNQHIVKAIACFRETLTEPTKVVVVDLSKSRAIDARFFGLLLMFRKILKEQGAQLKFVGASPSIRRMFRLNALGFLLSLA